MQLDFFVAGAQKAGTTALHEMLRVHAGLDLPDAKELHFFDDESRDWASPSYDSLHCHFDWTHAAMRGEATPIYLYWPNALERLRAYNPAAKIIIGLRHPVFRAYSHWRMEVSREAEALDFSSAIRSGRERVRHAPHGVHRVYSYVERGYYDTQVERLLSLFPRKQVHFFRTDELFEHPARVLALLWSFLGVDPAADAHDVGYVAPVANRVNAEINAADRLLLEEEYRGRYNRIEELTGLDLSDWRERDYTEPMRAGMRQT